MADYPDVSSTARTFLTFFALQFVSYLNITVDYRAVAHGQYLIATLTNGLAPLIAWVMVKKVSHDTRGWVGMVAVVLGGVSSTWLGMWVTRAW